MDFENSSKSKATEQLRQQAKEWTNSNALFDAINQISDPHSLEITGSALSLPQFLALLDHEGINTLHEKLSPLFVGMTTATFRALLENASQSQLKLLKQEAVTEPLQHQLTLLTDTLSNDVIAFGNDIFTKELELNTLPLAEITPADIQAHMNDIESLAEKGLDLLPIFNKALTIAWHTNRTDLIEHLSYAKEFCQKSIADVVGSARTPDHSPSGLWAILEKRLNSVYEEFEGSTKTLQDDVPAMEALSKFSVWYLKDYWEIGLLPQVAGPAELELNPETHPEKECLEYREGLVLAAKHKLEQLGLFTLADLKKAQIYSRKALQGYIGA